MIIKSRELAQRNKMNCIREQISKKIYLMLLSFSPETFSGEIEIKLKCYCDLPSSTVVIITTDKGIANDLTVVPSRL